MRLQVRPCEPALILASPGQAPMYYRGANAAILVYDITNEESLTDIQVWLDGESAVSRSPVARSIRLS